MSNSIEIYRSEDGSVQLNVKLENETVWLTQSQMAELFNCDRNKKELSFTPIRDKIAISCMLREIHEFSSHAIRHGLYIKNRKRLFCP